MVRRLEFYDDSVDLAHKQLQSFGLKMVNGKRLLSYDYREKVLSNLCYSVILVGHSAGLVMFWELWGLKFRPLLIDLYALLLSSSPPALA